MGKRDAPPRPYYGPENYIRALPFLNDMRRKRKHLRTEEMEMLRTLALQGNIGKAADTMYEIITRRCYERGII